jgi:hypothetical protein
MPRVCLLLLLLVPLSAQSARRIGRVFVVANANSEASLRVARRYCELRKLPAWNLYSQPFGDRVEMSPAEFAAVLKAVPNEVDVLAFSLDVPFRIGPLSVTGALMNGQAGHPWFAAEMAFDRKVELGMQRVLPSCYLAGYNVEDTERMLADSLVRYPDAGEAGTFFFCTGVGARGARNGQIDLAVQRVQKAGGRAAHSRSHNLSRERDVLGQFTGHSEIDLSFASYLPGSIIDNLSGLGGYLRGQDELSTVGDFIHAGASAAFGVTHGSYGTGGFANLGVADLYLKGLPLFEVYLRSVYDWRVGLLVGDPLMAPFAKPPTASLTVNNGQAEIVASDPRLTRAELWLNDERLLTRLEAVPARGTALRVRVTHGSLNLQREALADGKRPAAELLTAASAGAPLNMQLFPYDNKLLVRWRPSPLEFLNHRRARGSCLIEIGDHSRHVPLVFREISGECAVCDLGAVPPVRYDKLVVTIGGKPVIVEATGQESLRKFLIRAGQEISKALPPGWSAYHEQVSGLPSREELWISALKPDTKRLDIRVSAERGPRSQFAKSADWSQLWQRRSVARVAEALITTDWPIRELRKTLAVPTGTLTLVARNANGLETIVQHGGAPTTPPPRPVASGLSHSFEGRTLQLRGPFLHSKVTVTSAGRRLFVKPHPRYSDAILIDMSLFSRRSHALRIDGGPGEVGGVTNVTVP